MVLANKEERANTKNTQFTLGGLLEKQARIFGEKTFALFADTSEITYSDLFDRACAVAKGMAAHGVGKGDRVAIQMPNCLDYLVVYFAIQALGAIGVLVNARFKTHELSHVVKHSDARMFFTTDVIDDHVNFVDLLSKTLPELENAQYNQPLRLSAAPALDRVILCGDSQRTWTLSLDSLIEQGNSVSDTVLVGLSEETAQDDIALMLYTSGTTAAPKGCQLTHKGIFSSWGGYANAANVKSGETIWAPLPFFHVGGIGPLTAAMSKGASFLTATHFNPSGALKQIRANKPEHLYPAFSLLMFQLLHTPGFTRQDLNCARTMLCVAPTEAHYDMRELLPDHLIVMQVYGLTEGSGVVTITQADMPLDYRLSKNGVPLPNTEIRIVDPQTGKALGADHDGEIQFRGHGAFHSYYKDDVATGSTLLDGNWVATGDSGRLEKDGTLCFGGRIKDMLKVGGENVAAAEVEAFLSSHPAVKMSQIVGKQDKTYGEVPVAFIELRTGHEASEQELIDFFEGRMAKFKVPRKVIFVTDWPMSATKIQKFKLRERLQPASEQ